MTMLAPIRFAEPELKDTKIEREVVERHRAVCDRCGWKSIWFETDAITKMIKGVHVQAVGALGLHIVNEHP